MADAPRQASEFFWRRLSEPPELFGQALDFDPRWWLALAAPLLALALVLVVRLYIRDGKAVGWGWGALLATLRTLVFVTLFVVWLLPAVKEVEYTEQHSRVLLVFDVSASLQASDEPPADLPGPPRETRQEIVLDLLKSEEPAKAGTPTSQSAAAEAGFVSRLLHKNPLVCYRFGEQLDDREWQVTKGHRPSFLEWSRRLQPTLRPTLGEPVFQEALEEFARAGERLQKLDELEEPAKERRQADIVKDLERALAEHPQLHERLLNRTNLGEALLQVLRKESGNLVQGIIVFSDGRNNAGSTSDLTEVVKQAKKAKIPVFTVGVGVHRETPNLRLVDVLAPSQVQPEDEFPVRVAVEAENLPRAPEATVILTIERPDLPKEELTQKITLTDTTSRLATGAAEFRINLAEIFFKRADPKTPEVREKLKGDWTFKARVTHVKGERTRSDNVSETPAVVKVIDRKPSVLLLAHVATRDYQFLRTMLIREQDKFELTIHLQTVQDGVVQDVDPKRLLPNFPNNLRDRDGDPMNLGNYDVVVAFDPDWRALPPAARENLYKWVQDFAGGLIVEAGPVHTFALARDKDLKVIRDLYPVELDNTATSFTMMERSTKEPWALNWGPTASQMTFLDLTESGDKAKVLEGWEQFFGVARNPNTGAADQPAKRGFFSFFPVRDRKLTADVLARFADPKALTHRGERQPFMVMHTVRKGQVFYLGSGEMYRLRAYSEKYLERFWAKLIRHLGRGDLGRGSRRGLLVAGSRYVEGDTVEVEAQLLDAEMKPLKLDPNEKVLLRVQPPQGMTDFPREWLAGLEMKPAPGRPGWFSARFPVRRAGNYALQLDIPGTRETLAGKFRVEGTDPERDATRPDFALLHRLASDARELEMPAENERKRPEVMKALGQARELMKTQAKNAPPGVVTLTPENETERLFFVLGQDNLSTAELIPDCLDSRVDSYRTEGRVTDLWDKGWTVFQDIHHPENAEGPPWALVLLVTLISAEWLTRKLLKLA